MKKLLIPTLMLASSAFAYNDVSLSYDCALKKGNKLVSTSVGKKYLSENEDISATNIENKYNFSRINYSFFILRDANATSGYMVGVKKLKKGDQADDIALAHTGHLVSLDYLDKETVFEISKKWTLTCNFSNIN